MSNEPEQPPQTSAGVYIMKGMQISIPVGGLVITQADGKLDAKLTLHLHFDVTSTWLDLAWEFMHEAIAAREAGLEARTAKDEEGFSNALERELRSGMLAITSAATALEAFYAGVKDKISMPTRSARPGDAKRRPTRLSVMSESFKQGFRFGNKTFDRLRNIIKEICEYRDRAVHPDGAPMEAAYHPQLNLMMERRLVQFRHENARAIVGMAHSIIYQLLLRPKQTNTDLREYCERLEPQVAPLVERWEEKYGPLFERQLDSDQVGT